jgi:hypothetical protein
MLWCYIKSKTKTIKDKTGREKLVAYGPAKGVLVAIEKKGVFTVGWSLVNSKHDKFNASYGRKLAEGRALGLMAKIEKKTEGSEAVVEVIPAKLKKQYMRFIDRANRYYKGNSVVAYSVVTDRELLTVAEKERLSRLFDGDEKPAEAASIESSLPTADELLAVRRKVLGLPSGINDFFMQVGKETLLIRKVDKAWKVEKV